MGLTSRSLRTAALALVALVLLAGCAAESLSTSASSTVEPSPATPSFTPGPASPIALSTPTPTAETAESYLNRGVASFKKGNYDQAIANYDRAIKLKPAYVIAYYDRGLAH